MFEQLGTMVGMVVESLLVKHSKPLPGQPGRSLWTGVVTEALSAACLNAIATSNEKKTKLVDILAVIYFKVKILIHTYLYIYFLFFIIFLQFLL